jgi:hypothetical protein
MLSDTKCAGGGAEDQHRGAYVSDAIVKCHMVTTTGCTMVWLFICIDGARPLLIISISRQ